VVYFALLAGLLGLAACENFQPPMSHYTARGEPCHPIGYSYAPIWVAPDGHTVCTQ
jgi:hypothetical protein